MRELQTINSPNKNRDSSLIIYPQLPINATKDKSPPVAVTPSDHVDQEGDEKENCNNNEIEEWNVSSNDISACTSSTSDSNGLETVDELKRSNISLKEDNISLIGELRRTKTRMDMLKNSSSIQITSLEMQVKDSARGDTINEEFEFSDCSSANENLEVSSLREESVQSYKYMLKKSKDTIFEKNEQISELQKFLREQQMRLFDQDKELKANEKEIENLKCLLRQSMDSANGQKDRSTILNERKVSPKGSCTDQSRNFCGEEQVKRLRSDLTSKIQKIVHLELKLEDCLEELAEERTNRLSDVMQVKDELQARHNAEKDHMRRVSFNTMERMKNRAASLENKCKSYEKGFRDLKDKSEKLKEENFALKEHLAILQEKVASCPYGDNSAAMQEITRLQLTLKHMELGANSSFCSPQGMMTKVDCSSSFFQVLQEPEKSFQNVSSMDRLATLESIKCDSTCGDKMSTSLSKAPHTTGKQVQRESEQEKTSERNNLNMCERTYVFNTPKKKKKGLDLSSCFTSPRWRKRLTMRRRQRAEF